jgi:hypothetical protein
MCVIRLLTGRRSWRSLPEDARSLFTDGIIEQVEISLTVDADVDVERHLEAASSRD